LPFLQAHHPHPEDPMTTPALLPVGTRVRHIGEQYHRAFAVGTASVVGHAPALDGSTEYLVERDAPLLPGMSTRTQWAAYATRKVTR
jgi:hypothetical protein